MPDSVYLFQDLSLYLAPLHSSGEWREVWEGEETDLRAEGTACVKVWGSTEQGTGGVTWMGAHSYPRAHRLEAEADASQL